MLNVLILKGAICLVRSLTDFSWNVSFPNEWQYLKVAMCVSDFKEKTRWYIKQIYNNPQLNDIEHWTFEEKNVYFCPSLLHYMKKMFWQNHISCVHHLLFIHNLCHVLLHISHVIPVQLILFRWCQFYFSI